VLIVIASWQTGEKGRGAIFRRFDWEGSDDRRLRARRRAFYVFWEAMLLPMSSSCGVGEDRAGSSHHQVIYVHRIGSYLMMVALIYVLKVRELRARMVFSSMPLTLTSRP